MEFAPFGQDVFPPAAGGPKSYHFVKSLNKMTYILSNHLTNCVLSL